MRFIGGGIPVRKYWIRWKRQIQQFHIDRQTIGDFNYFIGLNLTNVKVIADHLNVGRRSVKALHQDSLLDKTWVWGDFLEFALMLELLL